MKGTFLNTATVAAGAGLGLVAGEGVPDAYRQIAMGGLGLVTTGIGIKLFLQSKSVIVVAAAIALGGVVGLALGIQGGLESVAEWTRVRLGGGGRFTEGLVTASILFCVGPMTLIGCIKDGLQGDSELLNLKSTMDGFVAFFFAAALGRSGAYGVLMSAVVILVFQGLLTLMARPLKSLADDPQYMAEATGAGGTLLMAIGLGLLEIKRMPVANFLPALAFAPLFVFAGRFLGGPRARSRPAPVPGPDPDCRQASPQPAESLAACDPPSET